MPVGDGCGGGVYRVFAFGTAIHAALACRDLEVAFDFGAGAEVARLLLVRAALVE